MTDDKEPVKGIYLKPETETNIAWPYLITRQIEIINRAFAEFPIETVIACMRSLYTMLMPVIDKETKNKVKITIDDIYKLLDIKRRKTFTLNQSQRLDDLMFDFYSILIRLISEQGLHITEVSEYNELSTKPNNQLR